MATTVVVAVRARRRVASENCILGGECVVVDWEVGTIGLVRIGICCS